MKNLATSPIHYTARPVKQLSLEQKAKLQIKPVFVVTIVAVLILFSKQFVQPSLPFMSNLNL